MSAGAIRLEMEEVRRARHTLRTTEPIVRPCCDMRSPCCALPALRAEAGQSQLTRLLKGRPNRSAQHELRTFETTAGPYRPPTPWAEATLHLGPSRAN
ncbi:MAG: hypothetical protein RLZZ157_446 [Pseudomonadota bacterium]|jgi:hypothetical protein